MKSFKRTLIFSGIIAASAALAVSCGEVAVDETPVFEAGESCTAYRVGKRMFLVNSLTVTGKNCTSEFTVTKDESAAVIRVKVPVSGFSSGEAERDAHTAGILGGPEHDSVEFVSAPVALSDWDKAVAGGSLLLKGNLKVAGKESPVETEVVFTAEGEGYSAAGKVMTSFSANGLQAPKVAGGLVASVNDTLELHFQVKSSAVK